METKATEATVHPRHRTRALLRLRDQRRQHRLYRSRLANLIHLSLTHHPSPDPGVVLTDQALLGLLKTHPRQTRQASQTSRANPTGEIIMGPPPANNMIGMIMEKVITLLDAVMGTTKAEATTATTNTDTKTTEEKPK